MTDTTTAKQPANSKNHTKRSAPGTVTYTVPTASIVKKTVKKKVKAVGGKGKAKGLSNVKNMTVTPPRNTGTQEVKVKKEKLDTAESTTLIKRI